MLEIYVQLPELPCFLDFQELPQGLGALMPALMLPQMCQIEALDSCAEGLIINTTLWFFQP